MKTNTQQILRLGIDIGRVIMSPVSNGKSDTTFLSGTLEESLATPPSPGAMNSVANLVEAFDGLVWLVSKAGPSNQRKTWLWLEQHDFYRKTGLPPSHVRFCLKRQEKAQPCEQLKINYFIDDRLDVLNFIKHCVRKRYLFGEQPSNQSIPPWVNHVIDWPETLKTVMADMKNEHFNKQ